MGYLRNRGTPKHPEWYIRFKDVDGKWKQRHAKAKSKDKAREILADAEQRVKRGLQGIVDPTPAELSRKTITVEELVRRFLGEAEGHPGYAPPKIKDLKSYRRDARKNLRSRLPSAFASRPASAICLADIEQVRDGLTARGLAGSSVVQVIAALSKLFNWGRRAGLIEGANPVVGVERPRCASSIDYLDRTEVAALFKAAEAEAVAEGAEWNARVRWPMIATAVYCGPRKGELFGLRWSDVQLEAGRLDVLRSYRLLPKSGKPRHVTMHPELVRILRQWRERSTGASACEGLVFPVEGEAGRLRMGTKEDGVGLVRALVRAECHLPTDGHTWHMLRHTFASHFIMAGGSLLTLQRLLGHSTPTMTMRYAHLAPDFLSSEVARMSFAPPPANGVPDLGEERRRRAAGAVE